MVFKYVTESEEDIEMDVQVGPKEEVEAEVGDKPEELTAVDLAKKEPETVVVAAVEKEKAEEAGDEGCEECEHEFYVDARDVEKYAKLNEKTMLESLNDIIAANEADGMRADNLVVVMTESTMGYARNLEKNGAAMMFIKEADEEAAEEDIEIDVQVGPDGEEKVAEDPQEANPVDAVKRDYNSVVVAKDGDEFFVDVEDVQKCADINCESVIKTLNGIIAANEEAGMEAGNLKVIIGENAKPEAVEAMEAAGVNFFLTEAGINIGDVNGFNMMATKLIASVKKIINKLKKDDQASVKYTQSIIDQLDKTITRVDEEIEEADNKEFKASATRIAKLFFGYLSLYFTSGMIGGVVGAEIGSAVGNVVTKGRRPKAARRNITKTVIKEELLPYAAILSTVMSIINTGFVLADYKNALKEWKKNLVAEKKRLEGLLK